MNLIQNSNEEGLKFIFNDFQKTFPVMAKRENKFGSDDERLKTLNMQAETFKFLQKQLPRGLPENSQLESMSKKLSESKSIKGV